MQNAIRRNSIFGNGGLGIDLNANGVTLNDLGDEDVGANGLQNYPVLTGAVSTTKVVSIHLNSKASKTYAIEFFSSHTCDPSSHGEGQTYIGTYSVTTNLSGNAAYSHAVTGSFASGSKSRPPQQTPEETLRNSASATPPLTNYFHIRTRMAFAMRVAILQQTTIAANTLAWGARQVCEDSKSSRPDRR